MHARPWEQQRPVCGGSPHHHRGPSSDRIHGKHLPRKRQDAAVKTKSSSTKENQDLQNAKQVQEKKLLPADEVYHGALEDILLGLKSEPYRRADAVRRSQRRRNNTNRLSRNLEDLEGNF